MRFKESFQWVLLLQYLEALLNPRAGDKVPLPTIRRLVAEGLEDMRGEQCV